MKMFLRFQKIALNVSYGFRQYSPLFLIEVFLIEKSVYYGNFLQRNLEEQKRFEMICTPTANPNRMSAIKISIPTD